MDFFAWQDVNRKQQQINTEECDPTSLLHFILLAYISIAYYRSKVVAISANILTSLSFNLNVKAKNACYGFNSVAELISTQSREVTAASGSDVTLLPHQFSSILS